MSPEKRGGGEADLSQPNVGTPRGLGPPTFPRLGKATLLRTTKRYTGKKAVLAPPQKPDFQVQREILRKSLEERAKHGEK